MSEIERPSLTNQHVAGDLREAADLLEEKGASPYRTGAYRRAADTIERLGEPITELLRREGVGGLRTLPGIGPSLSAAIEEIVRTGQWSRLDGYRAGSDPIALLRSLPGVGPVLARRIYDALHVETLEGLEAAARDGRLERVEGVGAGRARRVQAALEALFGRSPGPTKVNAA
jgi:DNA polymerase/3'-5' exonuclease PolX